MTRTMTRFIPSALACGLLLLVEAHAATITGKVVDTTNHPVASAIITINEEPATPSKPPAFRGASTTAAPDGTFSFNNLEAGTYLLCAQLPKGALINPCQWTKAPPPQVALVSATATSSITLTMRPGYRLPIRVDDPQGLLTTHEGKTPGAHLLIGIHGGYIFEVADIDSTDPAGRNVSVLVPFDAPVNVAVQSRFFKLQDASGNSINKTGAMPITASSAAPTAKLNIKIAGNN
jgi:hypothetical protein